MVAVVVVVGGHDSHETIFVEINGGANALVVCCSRIYSLPSLLLLPLVRAALVVDGVEHNPISFALLYVRHVTTLLEVV